MLTRLGWSNAASSLMYENQVIIYIDKFRYLYNESAKTICKVLRRPGGVMETGDPDPGVKVNARAESNFILAV